MSSNLSNDIKTDVEPRQKRQKVPGSGRKERYTVEQVKAALRASGSLVTSAAARLGCEPGTIYDYMARYPELAAARREMIETVNDLAEANVLAAVKAKNLSASYWWLTKQARARGYGEAISGVELTSDANGAVAVKIIFDQGGPTIEGFATRVGEDIDEDGIVST